MHRALRCNIFSATCLTPRLISLPTKVPCRPLRANFISAAAFARLPPPTWLEWSHISCFSNSHTIWSRWYRTKHEAISGRSSKDLVRKGIPSFNQDPRWKRLIERIPHNFIIYGILGLNVAVYLGWKYAEDRLRQQDPHVYMAMAKNFLMSWQNIEEGRIWTIVTACFSHSTAGHIFLNALTFYFMAPPVLRMLGNTAFLSLYLTGGVVCCAFSLLFNKTVRNRSGSSNGASGAIYSVLTFFACAAPHATFLLFFAFPMPAWAVVSGLFAWDLMSTVTDRRSQTDSAGHIGGMLAGVAYYLLKIRRL